MKSEEFNKVIKVLNGAYRGFLKDKDQIDVWFNQLNRFSYENCIDAVNEYIGENNKTPAPADIIVRVKQIASAQANTDRHIYYNGQKTVRCKKCCDRGYRGISEYPNGNEYIIVCDCKAAKDNFPWLCMTAEEQNKWYEEQQKKGFHVERPYYETHRMDDRQRAAVRKYLNEPCLKYRTDHPVTLYDKLDAKTKKVWEDLLRPERSRMHDIEFFEDEHKYLVDGKEVPSVTTILNYITADHYGAINQSVLQRAAARGTAVHEALQMYDLGGETEVFPEIEPYVRAYFDFLNTYTVSWYSIEKVLYNEFLGYCGTVDRFGSIDGRDAVLDLKTTSSPNKASYLSVSCQTYAYALAIGNPTAKRYALYLKSDGDFRLVDLEKWESKNNVNPAEIFIQCLELYKKIKEITG